MNHYELVPKCSLLEVHESGVTDVVKGPVSIMNWYQSVLSLRFLSLVLLRWSRDLSPKIFRSGRWSTAMVRFLQPSTNCLALSRASGTAKASPSMGAYLDLAG